MEETADYSEAMGYWKTAAPQFLCPVLTLVLWQKHVKLVFENGMGTKHSMSLMYWRARFLQKSSEDVHTILSGMGERIFSLSNPFFYILLLLILVIVARKYFLRQSYTEERQTALIVLVSYIVYQLGLLGTYLFSMPTDEGRNLAAYDRYHRTIVLYLAGLACIVVLRQIIRWKDRAEPRGRAVAVLLALMSVLLIQKAVLPRLYYYERQSRTSIEEPLFFNRLISENSVAISGKILLIYTKELPEEISVEHKGFYLYILRYLLPNGRCSDNFWPEDSESIMADWKSYDGIIVICKEHALPESLARWLGDTFGTTDPVIDLSLYK